MSTIERALVNERKFDMNSKIAPWLYKIMQNRYINQKNKNRLVDAGIEEELEPFYTDKQVSSREIISSYKATKERHQDNEIQKRQFEVFELAHHGFSTTEIAEKMKLPTGTIKSDIHRARKILIEAMKEFQYED